MDVNDALVDNLANLARLSFTEWEKAGIKADLQRMIAFVEKLREVNTEGTEPLLHMSQGIDVFREDEVSGSMSKTAALKNAPGNNNDYFTVPKVIKK
ncbi:MAG: Asp-tRNA(Asn)/Glu-tRNA(Gln) amidotransferase subunit GatC [Gemmatimonadaceae bacterium]|nr:Asp-tRNA(Asn)/Glu-tRNA(Gln) amidotransferase subunit GatC [Chitinophagaceae bacterium]